MRGQAVRLYPLGGALILVLEDKEDTSVLLLHTPRGEAS